MTAKQLTYTDQIKAFMFAGKAKFTIVSPKTGVRFTYKVKKIPHGNGWFVSLLSGPNNELSYSYLGIITANGELILTRKSRVTQDATSYKALDFLLKHLKNDRILVEFWHEGKCGRCGRTLTVPESIERGIGPECAGKLAIA